MQEKNERNKQAFIKTFLFRDLCKKFFINLMYEYNDNRLYDTYFLILRLYLPPLREIFEPLLLSLYCATLKIVVMITIIFFFSSGKNLI